MTKPKATLKTIKKTPNVVPIFTGVLNPPSADVVREIFRIMAHSEHAVTINDLCNQFGFSCQADEVKAHVLWLFSTRIIYMHKKDTYLFPNTVQNARFFTNPKVRDFIYWITKKDNTQFDMARYLTETSRYECEQRTY